ncbi:hypothetical protein QZJ86_02315 [Methylomonas montana]|uniref:AAA family ATPase n=1 Tax=Methylomonas montana TaxID=3058963 RepID=UPI00265819C1|nr:response regulator [Methylomonas montana]WKJ90981.1 hypothetical protein QZJ86_02315 [Methylomonas montana]
MSAEARHIRPAFVLITDNESVTRRLNDSIGDEGDLLIAEPSSLERILQIIDSVSAMLAIIHIPVGNHASHLDLIEELHASKPLLPLLVFTESWDSDMVLEIMRSGACDLITKESSRDEIRDRLRRIMKKTAHYATIRDKPRGKIIGIVSARPDADSAILCLHLGLALRQHSPESKTLLLDLGIPEADSLSFLDLQASYSFVDAVRSIRRFDETLIETAFAKHHSGLALLAMAEESTADDITANDVIVLLNILRSYFQYVVVNLSGLPKSQFLQLTTVHADQLFLLCEQTVPSCRSNKKLMDFLLKNQPDCPIELIVDRYLDKQEPSGAEIAERLGLPLRTILPSSGLARLYMKNSGRTLFEFAPQDKYAQAIEQFAKSLLGLKPLAERRSWLSFFTSFLQKH